MENDNQPVDESTEVIEERKPSFFKRHKKLVLVAIIAGVVSAIVGGIAASAVTPPGQQTITCKQVESSVGPDGHVVLSLDCTITAPSPTPTSTPGATPSATASPTPGATTPAPTTPAPTTPAPTASSPSPTPTVTGTGLKLKNCFPQLVVCGYPSLDTTGVPSGVTLTDYTGPSTITTPGTVIDGKRLGCITIKAKNVVIKNSTVTGPCFYAVDVENSGSLTISDTTINCVNNTGTGIVWGNYTATRVEIHHCENGLSTTSNILFQDSYITDVIETNGGHGDGIQGESGSNIIIRHNTFDLWHVTSSIIWDKFANANTISHALVEDNFFTAGAFTIYCPTYGSDVVYRNNRFYAPIGNTSVDRHRPTYGFWYDTCGKSWQTFTGNYRDDTLTVIAP